ncbi:MAG: NYN domain-containing protein [bacterium]
MKVAILVDGYNVVYSSPLLRRLLKKSVYQAQEGLIRLVSNYFSMKGVEGYVVFDAYRRPYLDTRQEISTNLKIILTGKGKTADSYIESFTSQYKSSYDYIYVVTADYSQRMTVLDKGILLLSPQDFLREIETCQKALTKKYSSIPPGSHLRVSDYLEDGVRKKLERITKGQS